MIDKDLTESLQKMQPEEKKTLLDFLGFTQGQSFTGASDHPPHPKNHARGTGKLEQRK